MTGSKHRTYTDSTWDNDQNPFHHLGLLSTRVSPAIFNASLHWPVNFPDEYIHEALCDSYEFIHDTVKSSSLKYKGKAMKSYAACAIRNVYGEGQCSKTQMFQLLQTVSLYLTNPLKALYRMNVIEQLHVPLLQFLSTKDLICVEYVDGVPINVSLTARGDKFRTENTLG